MKYLLLSLPLFCFSLLSSYTAHSLGDSKIDVVETSLAEERATATTDPDYTVLEAVRIAQDNLRSFPNQHA